ncbi:exopolysaccharide biosynthesis protein [Chroococcus sp. FPU101]|uniref:exopolysaccharide biosynthesis protein n=1 Tax=Chroococcus sp. FPU101 TaxID=1974212 RepID=UPI001A8D108B|nr:exopolysaccharide biosynthesis protein [Chroococcus sp. FPU101]GFE72018.1 exopolysaccharide synthesis protein [Chroococcus sp. FPU101]
MSKLSTELETYFFEEQRNSAIQLEDILTLAGERIFGFLFVILALPSALPLPAPGYSTPFGILIAILGLQMITGAKTPWFPEKMRKGSMKLELVQKFVRMGIPWLKRIEAIARPRMSYICTSVTGRVIIGIAITLMGISMIIPIPGTNTFPAMGIFVTAFGLQEDDGFISLIGLIMCVLAGILSTSIIIAVIWGGSSLLDLLKQSLGR